MLGMNKKKPNKDGINLMAAILLCYPEIETVSYEPKKERLHFVFSMKSMPPQAKLDEAYELVKESIETYHELSGLQDRRHVQLYTEHDELLTLLHVERDFQSVTRGEISMLAELLRASFGELLVVEDESEKDDLTASREEAIDHFLDRLRGSRVQEQLVGIREEGKVVVFNK